MRSEGGEDDLQWGGAAKMARSKPPRAWESADLIVPVLTGGAPASSSSSPVLPSVVAQMSGPFGSAETSDGSRSRMSWTHVAAVEGRRDRAQPFHRDLHFDQEGKRRLGRRASGGHTSTGGEDTVGAGDRGGKTRTFTWRGSVVRNRTTWRSGRIGVNNWGGEKSHVAADRAVRRHAWLRTAKTSGAVRDVGSRQVGGRAEAGILGTVTYSETNAVQRNRKLTNTVADPVQVAPPRLEVSEGQEQRISVFIWSIGPRTTKKRKRSNVNMQRAATNFATWKFEDESELLASATSMAKLRDNSGR
ncbi:hypothetical protein K438DRAFT_2165683 [Mycena galopus ATCC 62051]|nr:hypothetical protein K438DRAFT_2165683 [Mycena galopus ATCC 62051]